MMGAGPGHSSREEGKEEKKPNKEEKQVDVVVVVETGPNIRRPDHFVRKKKKTWKVVQTNHPQKSPL